MSVKRRFKIPSAFHMGAHRFVVKYISPGLMMKREDGVECYGVFYPDELTIWLCPPSKTLRKSIVIETFWHEYAHALLWCAGGKWKDEKVVQAMAVALKQSHESWEYE